MNEHNGNSKRRLLIGAAAISEVIYGDRNSQRKVFHLAASSNAPIFRLGSRLAAWDEDLDNYLRPKPRRDDDDKEDA